MAVWAREPLGGGAAGAEVPRWAGARCPACLRSQDGVWCGGRGAHRPSRRHRRGGRRTLQDPAALRRTVLSPRVTCEAMGSNSILWCPLEKRLWTRGGRGCREARNKKQLHQAEEQQGWEVAGPDMGGHRGELEAPRLPGASLPGPSPPPGSSAFSVGSWGPAPVVGTCPPAPGSLGAALPAAQALEKKNGRGGQRKGSP